MKKRNGKIEVRDRPARRHYLWSSIFVVVLKIILIRVNTRGKKRDAVLLPGLFRDCEILVFIHNIGPFFFLYSSPCCSTGTPDSFCRRIRLYSNKIWLDSAAAATADTTAKELARERKEKRAEKRAGWNYASIGIVSERWWSTLYFPTGWKKNKND